MARQTRLVITRKPGERIMIGNPPVVVEVHLIDRGRVRLTIEAPEDVAVHREEVYNRIHGVEGEQ